MDNRDNSTHPLSEKLMVLETPQLTGVSSVHVKEASGEIQS